MSWEDVDDVLVVVERYTEGVEGLDAVGEGVVADFTGETFHLPHHIQCDHCVLK